LTAGDDLQFLRVHGPFGATFNEEGVRITQAWAKYRAAFRSSAFTARRYA
jgi:hypothetical protein